MVKFITLAGKKQVGKDTSAQYIKSLLTSPKTMKQANGCMDAIFKPFREEERVHIVHFADALKQACSIIFGIPLEDMETETGKQKLTHLVWPEAYTHGFGDGGIRKDGVESTADVWVPYTFSGPLSWHHSGTHQGNDIRKFMTVREVLQFVGTNLFRNQLDPDVWVQSVYRKKYRDDDIVIVADCRFPNECDFAKKQGILISVERETGLATDGHVSETALDSYTNYDYVIDNNGSFDELRCKLNTILTGSSLTV